MVFRLEEAIAAAAAPEHAHQRLCAAVFEATRYLMYASDAMVVILAETADPRVGGGGVSASSTGARSASPKRVPQFELWQVWNVNEPIRCVRFNHTHKIARGAVALCIDEGRGALLLPSSAAVSALAARKPPSAADARKLGSRDGEMADGVLMGSAQGGDVPLDYVKAHLHLQLPTWKETVRWKCEDRAMSELQWAERGEDLLLIGAGEKITIWKLVDDAVQVYLQHSFALGAGAPTERIRHFDVAQSGLLVATAGLHDRMLKVWVLDQLAPREGSPMRLFLPHARALVSIKWSKDMHTFKNVPPRDSLTAKCEMIFTLDKNGTISIWRENLTQRRSFALWKSIDSLDVCSANLTTGEEEVGARVATFGLVDNYWARQVDPVVESFGDLVLGESHMLSALCMFHYGHSTFGEARQNALYNQRMDGSAKMNTKLLGQRSGGVADTHGGETFVCGNATLSKTFSVHLMYGVHENGDLSLFRAEFISYSGVTPRISLLATCSRLRHDLAGSTVYRVSSSDFKDRENGAVGFTVLVIFQRTKGSTNLKFARLRLQAIRPSSPIGRAARGSVNCSVQECEVGDVCPSILNAPVVFEREARSVQHAEADSVTRSQASRSCAAIFQGELGVSTDTFDLFRVSPSLRSARMVHRFDCSDIEPSLTHNAYDKGTRLTFVFSGGVLRGYNVQSSPLVHPGAESRSHTSDLWPVTDEAKSEMPLCCADALDDDGVTDTLLNVITVGVPESAKKEWSASTSMFGGPSTPVHRDYSMVVGLKASGTEVVIWIFQVTPSEAPPDRVQLFRKSVVQVPHSKLLSIYNVPYLQSFEIAIATVDAELKLSVWTLGDIDDPRGLKRVHIADVANLLSGASQLTHQEENMAFHTVEDKFKFKILAISACGRAAVLVETVDNGNASMTEMCKICILSVVDTSLEGVVPIPPKQFGEVISLEWTPFVTPERDCMLLFVTSTSIGMIKCDCQDWSSRWSISWTSSRFDVRLHAVASLSNYPNTWISIGPSFARINLHDLDAGLLSVPSFQTAATSVLDDSAAESRQLPAHHPIMLLYLLARGCFRALEAVLDDVKEQIVRHEQSCYLRMVEDTRLNTLAPIELTKLLGSSEDEDERSEVYRKGKPRSGGSLTGNSAAPARASDLFADFGSYRRSPYSAASEGSGNDRADMLFAPRSAGVSTSVLVPADEVEAAPKLSAIERDVFVKFFQDHAASLSFLPNVGDSKVFLDIVAGMKKLLQWERDDARKKDAAALRFYTSLLWPIDQLETLQAADTSNDSGAGNAVGDTLTVRGICSEQVAWAAISDFQTELLQECFPLGKVSWKQMQQLRLPFWVRSVSQLASFTEKAAQAEYAATHDPFAVAIFYVLLGKTKLLASLFKMANQARICELLSNDFSDVRWKNAAIKNAYVLKAKQRYALSAAFFLLGGKAQEAIAVAEHDDKSLVLSFLIARLHEKWDFNGQDNAAEANQFGVGFAGTSFTGLSSSLLSVGGGGPFGTTDGQGCASESTRVCTDFLNTTVWSKAERHRDVYLQFLVKHLTGDTSKAVECLLSLPKGDMQCAFSADGSMAQPPTQYWRMFSETLLGASEIIRFLRKTISPVKVSTKEKIIKLNAVALTRMQGAGLTLGALFQQRDLSELFLELSKASPSSIATAELLSCRLHILTSTVGNQVDYLYTRFIRKTRAQLLSPAPALPEMAFEEQVDEAIESAVARAGKYRIEDQPETHNEYFKAALKQATVDSLKYSGRLAALDFLVARWNAATPLTAGHASTTSSHPFSSPVPQFIDFIIEGIGIVGAGNVVASATDQRHTHRVDQVCSELLTAASRLLIWLFCFHLKPAKERSAMESAGYVRLAVAAVYSVVCVCSRYIRCPSCLYRVCAITLPHKPPLSKKSEDRLRATASADVCVYCSTYRRPRPPTTPGKAPLLQDDIPALFQVVQMLQSELENFAADVKTNRLQLSFVDAFAPFSYCPYWTMLLVASCTAMPSHVSKIAALDSLPPQASHIKATGLKLVEAWWAYTGKISKFAIKHLLCELAGLHFSPFVVGSSASGATPSVSTHPNASGASSPVRRLKSTDATASDPDTPRISSPTRSSSASGGSSPVRNDSGSRRQLLKCSCADCPWLLVLNLFAEKNELLLRLSGQLDVCNEKINNEIAWGRLPEIPSRKAPLTRSQKILLTNVAGNPASSNRASDLSDLLQKRGHAPTSTGVSVQSVYRSETNIKAICFNRAADTVELVYCSSKGICRTSSVDYSNGGKLQFKGNNGAPPSSVFFPDTPPSAAQRKSRGDGGQFVPSRGGEDMLPPPVPAPSVRMNASSGSVLSSSPHEAKAPSFKPTTVESHPFLPLYVSGNHKGQVHLWSFDSLSAMGAFRTKEVVSSYPSSPSRRDVKAIRFDNLGQQMGAVDNTGHLLLWKFASLDRATYYRDIECHDKGAKGLTFINSGSCVATVGVSSEKRSVCVWDTLLPTSKALIAAPVCHPAGATAVVFSSTHQLLISGGESGAISVFDMRQRRVLHNLSTAHETAIKTLALHPSGACLLSGSASGDVKIWSLPIFREIATLGKVHSKQSFLGDAASNMAINVTNLSWGVTDSVATDDYFFTSGTDGSIQRVKVPALRRAL